MGLWLKCPGCQASNPLSLKVCPHCGHDLTKLSVNQRVYVIGPAAAPPAPSPPSSKEAAPAAPEPQEAAAQTGLAAAAAKPAKKPKKTRKKKS